MKRDILDCRSKIKQNKWMVQKKRGNYIVQETRFVYIALFNSHPILQNKNIK